MVFELRKPFVLAIFLSLLLPFHQDSQKKWSLTNRFVICFGSTLCDGICDWTDFWWVGMESDWKSNSIFRDPIFVCDLDFYCVTISYSPLQVNFKVGDINLDYPHIRFFISSVELFYIVGLVLSFLLFRSVHCNFFLPICNLGYWKGNFILY